MSFERLHIFKENDWKEITDQFTALYVEVFDFVTENKGSHSEAREVYVESFLYYTQLLELHGMNLKSQGADILYSFARCVWVKKLRKRNVDVNFVTHKREYFEMEDAFNEIDSITDRSSKTANKLAEIGEPARTLVLDSIGKGFDLAEVGPRLGYSDMTRVKQQIAKSIRTVIKLTEGKEIDLDAVSFDRALAYTLDSNSKSEKDEFDKLNLAMISRTVALIKNYVTRNKRLELFKEMETHFEPVVISANKEQKTEKAKSNKMRPALVFLASALVALVVSALTAFGLSGIRDTPAEPEPAEIITPEIKEPEAVIEVVESTQSFTAFAISNDGYLITTADAVGTKTKVRLEGNGTNRSLSGDVVKVDTLQNLALIKCNFEKGMRLAHMFSTDNPSMGQTVFTLGIPKEEVFYTMAEINVNKENNHGKVNLDEYAPGSPVLSDKGQVVGLIATQDATSGLSDVIYTSELNSFLETANTTLTEPVKTPRRNGLFYKNRVEQIDALTPYIWQVK